MKKVLVAFLMLAFVSVGFSATVTGPVGKQEKKEFVKSSEMINDVVVFVQLGFDSSTVKQPIVYEHSIFQSIFLEKFTKKISINKSLYSNYDYDYWDRFNYDKRIYPTRKKISG